MHKTAEHSPKLNILYFSWRDIKNPQKGGAEVYTTEILKRLVAKGHQATLFTARFDGGSEQEKVDGIDVIRKGNFFSVHKEAIEFYEEKGEEFDIVIDELHGYPFMTNFYAKQPKITVAHEVAGDIWFKMWPLPVALSGWFFERIYYKLLKKQPFITISRSTVQDLQKQGIPKGNIKVVHVGNDNTPLPIEQIKQKKNSGQLCFVGRICKMKGVDNLLRVFSQVHKQFPYAKLYLVGRMDPNFEGEIEKLISELDLGDKVIITGFVSDEERNKIMMQSEYIVSCSVKEGWGMIITEANVLGTPGITYDIEGFRDAIIDGETGFLVKEKTVEAMSTQIATLLRKSKSEGNDEFYRKIQLNAYNFGKKFNWDESAQEYERHVYKVMDKFQSDSKAPRLLQKICIKVFFTSVALFGGLAKKLRLV